MPYGTDFESKLCYREKSIGKLLLAFIHVLIACVHDVILCSYSAKSRFNFLYTPERKVYVGRVPKWFGEEDLENVLKKHKFSSEKLFIIRIKDTRLSEGNGDYSLISHLVLFTCVCLALIW